MQGRYDEAVAAFRHVAPAHPQQARALEAFAHARAGREDEARRILQHLTEPPAEQYISPYCLARVHAGLRDFEKAFAELERGVAERACWMVFLRVDPFLDELRNDPRFAALLDRVGLPDFTGKFEKFASETFFGLSCQTP